MSSLSPYKMSASHDNALNGNTHSQQNAESAPQTFVSLLEFVSEIYEVSILRSLSFPNFQLLILLLNDLTFTTERA